MCSKNHHSLAVGCHPWYMLPNHHEVQKDLRLADVQGRVSILAWCGRCRRLVLLELVNLVLKVVDVVVFVRECYSMVLHLLLKLFQLLLHSLDLQVLHSLVLIKLTGLNLVDFSAVRKRTRCRSNPWSHSDKRRRLLKSASSLS
jgi:hypothetical protein